MNSGHREPWRVMLNVLHGALTRKGETRNGLPLIDGDRADRGFAPVKQVRRNGARNLGSGDAVRSASAAAAGDAPLAARLDTDGMAGATRTAAELARSGAGGMAGASGIAPAGEPSMQGGMEVVGGTMPSAGGPARSGVAPNRGRRPSAGRRWWERGRRPWAGRWRWVSYLPLVG